MFWLGLCLIVASALAFVWLRYVTAKWIVVDALIVDHKEVVERESGQIFYHPIVEVRDDRGQKTRVVVATMSGTSKSRGTIAIQYPPGTPQMACVMRASTFSFPLWLGAAGIAAILLAQLLK